MRQKCEEGEACARQAASRPNRKPFSQCFFAARKPSCGKSWIVVDLSANLAVFPRISAHGKTAIGEDGSKQQEVGR
jgi:hypothetical protein